MRNGLKRKAKTNGHVESVSPDLLAVLQSSINKLQVAQIAKDAIVQEVVERYKLVGTVTLDLTTGIITREVKA